MINSNEIIRKGIAFCILMSGIVVAALLSPGEGNGYSLGVLFTGVAALIWFKEDK